MTHLTKLPGRAVRLVLLPFFIPLLFTYHVTETIFNGPHATGFWWKCWEWVKGLEEA